MKGFVIKAGVDCRINSDMAICKIDHVVLIAHRETDRLGLFPHVSSEGIDTGFLIDALLVIRQIPQQIKMVGSTSQICGIHGGARIDIDSIDCSRSRDLHGLPWLHEHGHIETFRIDDEYLGGGRCGCDISGHRRFWCSSRGEPLRLNRLKTCLTIKTAVIFSIDGDMTVREIDDIILVADGQFDNFTLVLRETSGPGEGIDAGFLIDAL